MDADDLVIIVSRNALSPIRLKSIYIIALLTLYFSFDSLIRKYACIAEVDYLVIIASRNAAAPTRH